MARAIEPFEKKAAKERKAATQGNKQTGSVKFTEPEKGDSRDKIAEAVGFSAPTLAKVRQVVDEGVPELASHQRVDATAKTYPPFGRFGQPPIDDEPFKVRPRYPYAGVFGIAPKGNSHAMLERQCPHGAVVEVAPAGRLVHGYKIGDGACHVISTSRGG